MKRVEQNASLPRGIPRGKSLPLITIVWDVEVSLIIFIRDSLSYVSLCNVLIFALRCLFLYVPQHVITLLITDQADQVPVFAKLASSESSRESGDGFPCPDNCSCHGSNIRCGSIEVTASSSTSTSTIPYPFFTSSSSTTEDTEDLYLDDHSAAVSSSLPSSLPVDSNELSVLSKRLNRLSKHLNRLSKQMNKLSKQMSECLAAANNKTGKHVKCYN